jgi:hypothetical protein
MRFDQSSDPAKVSDPQEIGGRKHLSDLPNLDKGVIVKPFHSLSLIKNVKLVVISTRAEPVSSSPK